MSLLRRVRGQTMLWQIGDQAVSSSTNFLLILFAAHSLGSSGLGALSAILAGYALALGASRALIIDPALARFGGSEQTPSDLSQRLASATATSGTLAIAVATLIGVTAHHPWLGLLSGAAVAMSLQQDALRFSLVVRGEIQRTFAIDAVWLVTQSAILLYVFGRETSLVTVLLAWLVGCFTSVAVAVIFLGFYLPRNGLHWLKENRKLGLPWLSEFFLQGGISQLSFLFIGGLVGLVDLGRIRLATLAFGPLLVLQQTALRLMLPHAVRRRESSAQALGRYCRRLSGVLAATCVLLGTTLYFMPTSIASRVFGDHWDDSVALIPIVTLYYASYMVATGPAVGLRASQKAKEAVIARLWISPLSLAFPVAGAVFFGVEGALLGMAFGAIALAGSMSIALAKAQRQNDLAPRMDSLG